MMKKLICSAGAVILCCLGMTSAVFAAYDTETVRQVQQALNDAGFDCGAPDGIAGEMTRAAVLAFEEANGLAADGEIDDLLIGILLDGDSMPGSQEEAGLPADAESQTEAEPREDLPELPPVSEDAFAGRWETIAWDRIFDGSDWVPVETAWRVYLPEEWEQAVPRDESCVLLQYGSLFYVTPADREKIVGLREYDTPEPEAPCLIVSVSSTGSRIIDAQDPTPVDLYTLDDYLEAYSRIKEGWTVTKLLVNGREALLCEIPESDITSLILLEGDRFYTLNIRCRSLLDDETAENLLGSVVLAEK